MKGRRFLDSCDAILFDMDGTLVDTEHLWFEAGRAAAAGFGVELPDASAAALHGLDVAALVGRLRADHGLEADDEVFSTALLEDVLKRLAGANARPGAGELVEMAAASGKRTALVSNSSVEVIEATLAPFGWAPLLERRFSVDEVERGKPEPDLYLHAASCLGVEPDRSVAIEDSVTGVTSAVRAGTACIGVTFGVTEAERLRRLTPLVVPSLEEAAKLLG